MDNFKIVSAKGQIDILEHFASMCERASNNLDELMTDDLVKSERVGRQYITEASKLRIDHDSFIASFFYNEPDTSLEEFADFLKDVGLPLIVRNEAKGAFTDIRNQDKISPYFFPVMKNILEILTPYTTSNNECSLITVCMNNEASGYDSKCHNDLKGKIGEANCPFASVWKMWGLS